MKTIISEETKQATKKICGHEKTIHHNANIMMSKAVIEYEVQYAIDLALAEKEKEIQQMRSRWASGCV